MFWVLAEILIRNEGEEKDFLNLWGEKSFSFLRIINRGMLDS